jgi:hypothetical protein
MKYSSLTFFTLILFLTSCTDAVPDADLIIKEAIKAHGVNKMEHSTMRFDFRGIDYSVVRNDGAFSYHRYLKIGADSIQDLLDNSGFKRLKNDTLLKLPDSLITRYTSSLNSVVYFAQLPYSLDGDAVLKRFIKKDTIAGSIYNEIEITFDQDGGGEDHEDVFLYWVNEETHLIDFLAYSFCEEDCGYRFRESINRRTINGIIVQDYNNYKSETLDPELSELDELFEDQHLTKVSTIELRRVTID